MRFVDFRPERGIRMGKQKAIESAHNEDQPALDELGVLPRLQATAVGELVGLVARNCLSDCQIGKYEATFLPVSIPSKIPSDTVNCNDFSRMSVNARSVKSL